MHWAELTEHLKQEPGFQRAMVRLARRLGASAQDGDEIYQESLIVAAKSMHKLDQADAWRAWFRAIVVHKAMHHHRWARRFLAMKIRLLGMATVAEVDDSEDRHLRAMRLRRALGLLPARDAQALVLHHIEGLSASEVGELLGISSSGARSLLLRGRQRLLALYEAADANRMSGGPGMTVSTKQGAR